MHRQVSEPPLHAGTAPGYGDRGLMVGQVSATQIQPRTTLGSWNGGPAEGQVAATQCQSGPAPGYWDGGTAEDQVRLSQSQPGTALDCRNRGPAVSQVDTDARVTLAISACTMCRKACSVTMTSICIMMVGCMIQIVCTCNHGSWKKWCTCSYTSLNYVCTPFPYPFFVYL